MPKKKSAQPSSRRGLVPAGTRAVVLAGGKGARLRPYTTLLPKPLVPIGDRPILEFVLQGLRAAGFDRVTLSVGHLAQLIQAYFGDGSKWGLQLDYSVEPRPLSTIGPLALIDDLGEDFLVMNGDVLTDLPIARLFRAHRRGGADLTVATQRREEKIDYGVLSYESLSHRIRKFTEKPSIPYDVSMGIYILNRRCLRYVEPGKPLGFDHLIETLLARRRPVLAYPYRGRWLDVGRPEDYELAQDWNSAEDGTGK
jgi:NDP-sugar pyrophosphorylase family protein